MPCLRSFAMAERSCQSLEFGQRYGQSVGSSILINMGDCSRWLVSACCPLCLAGPCTFIMIGRWYMRKMIISMSWTSARLVQHDLLAMRLQSDQAWADPFWLVENSNWKPLFNSRAQQVEESRIQNLNFSMSSAPHFALPQMQMTFMSTEYYPTPDDCFAHSHPLDLLVQEQLFAADFATLQRLYAAIWSCPDSTTLSCQALCVPWSTSAPIEFHIFIQWFQSYPWKYRQ